VVKKGAFWAPEVNNHRLLVGESVIEGFEFSQDISMSIMNDVDTAVLIPNKFYYHIFSLLSAENWHISTLFNLHQMPMVWTESTK